MCLAVAGRIVLFMYGGQERDRPLPPAKEDCAVRNALAGFAAARGRIGWAASPSGPAAEPRATRSVHASARDMVVGIVIAGMLLGAGLVLATGHAQGLGCEAITYALDRSAPAYARSDFNLAIQEIHQRTGLTFEAGEWTTAKLRVGWSDRRLSRGTSSPGNSDGVRLLGSGQGTWRNAHRGLELVAAAIEIDGTAPWQLGMSRANGLAAVFVHELGHAVIGLAHNQERGSFMYGRASEEPPHWTEGDRDRLARAGLSAGCVPPT